MKVKLIIAIASIWVCQAVHGQTMIGLDKNAVREIVKKHHREFRVDNTIVKQRFNYLKYVNGNRTKTWILYFTDEDICKTSKLICDYASYDDILEDLSSNYSKVGDSMWEYVEGADTLSVNLIRQEWYFTVRETKKE